MSKVINLLVGSGISLPSNIPGVKEITDRLLNGKWSLYQNKYVEIKDEDHQNETSIDTIQTFLNKVSEHYSTDHFKLNYEHLFEVIRCVGSDHFIYKDEYDKLNNIYSSITQDQFDTLDVSIRNIYKYFLSSIAYMLNRNDKIKGLSFLKELDDQDDITCNIFSLNHDLLIERFFKENNIVYDTGFNQVDGDVSLFDYYSLRNSEAKFRLFKLHGSIDWYPYPQSTGHIKQIRYGITSKDINNLKDAKGNKYEPIYDYPTFLSGTEKKSIDYNEFTFIGLRHLFVDTLYTSDALWVSGYGWQDEGISKVIYNWLNRSTENKLHSCYRDLKTETGFRDFDHYNYRNQIVNYDKYLMDTDAGDFIESNPY